MIEDKIENNNGNEKVSSVTQGETQEIQVITEELIENENENINNIEDNSNREEKKEVEEVEKKEVALVEKKEDGKFVVTNKDKDKSKNKKKLILIISIVSALFLLVLSFGIIVCVNKLNSNVYKNVYFMSQDMSDFDTEKIEEFVDLKNLELGKEIIIDVYQNDKKIATIESKDIGLKVDKEMAVKNVLGFGRNGNIFNDTFSIFNALINKINISPEYIYDVEKLNEILKNIDISLDGRFVEDSYNVDELNKKLIIKRGKSGIALEYTKIKEDLLNIILSGENSTLVVETKSVVPNKIDVMEIYNGVKREPKNASVDTSKTPIEITNEVYGIDFNIEELKNLLNLEENMEEEKEIEFALNFIEPQVKLRDLSYDLCLEKIAGLTTYFDATQYGRANNLRVALSYLNDQIIMPGEIFSYNAVRSRDI